MLVAEKKKKPVIGFYDLTGCQGCLLSFIFNEVEILDIAQHVDIKTFRFIKQKKENTKFDIVFVEGLVANKNDLALIKDLREKAEILIALGACACTGCVPAYRNFIDVSRYASLMHEKIKEISDVPATPIHAHVHVDYLIPGCPPDKKQIYSFIKDVLLGKTPKDYDKPVCFECRLNENRCLLDDGKMCLGPITRGGCDSICTNGGLECWGCRGPTPDANVQLMTKLLEEKGFSREHIRQRLRTFAGLQLESPSLKTVKPPKGKKQKKPEFRRGPDPVVVEELKPVKKVVKVKRAKKAVKKKPGKKKIAVKKKSVKKKPKKVKKPVKKKASKRKPVKKTVKKKSSAKKKAVKKKPAKKKAVKKNAVKKQKKTKPHPKRKTVKKVAKKVKPVMKAAAKKKSAPKKKSPSLMKMIKGFKKK